MSLNRTLIYFTSSFEATFSKSKIMKRKFHRELISRNHADRKYGVVGVPFGKGQLKSGVGNAPEAIRAQKLLTELHLMAYGGGLGTHPNLRTMFDQYYWFLSPGYDVKDYGDVTYPAVETAEKFDHNMKALEHIAACHKKCSPRKERRNHAEWPVWYTTDPAAHALMYRYVSSPFQVSEKVQDVIKDGRVCVTLGGDHSVSIGTIDGHVKARGNVAVLWVDAHADLNTADTSLTGNIHGMPVALLAKELSDYWPYIPGMDWQKPTLSIKQFAYIGLRSVDEYERVIMDKYSITAFGMEDIEYKGIVNIVNEALQSIDPLSMLPLHVSFDIDCLDPLEAPSTGTPGICYHFYIYYKSEGLGNVMNTWINKLDSLDVETVTSMSQPSRSAVSSSGSGAEVPPSRISNDELQSFRGGMSLREGIQVMEQAHRTGRLSAIDLVEVNPSIGDKRDVHLTIQAAKHLLQAVFGRQRRGNYPNDELVKLVNYNKLDKETNVLK
uniref:Arginase n=1 Tax=Timema poppense TaxID=170557 RepID=A0A7R9DDV0_TIMPO|nr:unnamed protein product [Timema poppensis]